MLTAHLPTVRSLIVSSVRVCVGGGGLGPPVNKFERVSSDGHQMSVVGGGVSPNNKLGEIRLRGF